MAVRVVGTAVEASSGSPPVGALWATQAVTLGVALVTGWFALRTKRVDVDETRRARFDARVDKELDDALADAERWRGKFDQEHVKALRLERLLIRAGIDPETGRRFDDDPSR